MRSSSFFTLAAVALAPLAACTDASSTAATAAIPTGPGAQRGGSEAPGVHRQYGTPVKVGNGRARSYIVLDARNGGAPLELGIALDEDALEGLPGGGGHSTAAGGEHKGHDMSGELLLPLPARNPTQYRLVELNWNPSGHPPEGVYTIPHFDFHFYTIDRAERDAIDPADPAFAAKADNLPAAPFVPAFNVLPVPPGVPASAIAVPRMGVHWSDVRSPELQGLFGNPAGYRPFTATFIYGSWNGRFIFNEPMVTRDFLLTKPDVEFPVGTAASYATPGYYPTAYRVQYDPGSKEYRVALTKLAQR